MRNFKAGDRVNVYGIHPLRIIVGFPATVLCLQKDGSLVVELDQDICPYTVHANQCRKLKPKANKCRAALEEVKRLIENSPYADGYLISRLQSEYLFSTIEKALK